MKNGWNMTDGETCVFIFIIAFIILMATYGCVSLGRDAGINNRAREIEHAHYAPKTGSLIWDNKTTLYVCKGIKE